MEEKATQNNTIDMRHLWQLVKQNIWRIIFWTVGLGIIGYALAAFAIPSKYTSSTQLLVNQKKNNNDPNSIYATQQANVQMVNTYKDIITSPVILKDASKYLANPTTVIRKARPAVYRRDSNGNRQLVRKARPAVIERDGKSFSVSVKQMQKAVKVSTQQQSQVFTLSATANTPDKSKAIANAVAKTFQKKVPDLMSVNNVTIVSDAATGVKTSPRVLLFTAAGLVLGFIIAFAIMILRDAMNTTVRTDDFMTKEVGLTNLGTVTHFHLSNSFSIKNTEDKKDKKRRRV
ncbi:capsular polysaccharide biosynthesis protein [Lactobacillus colini]|uniref:Capsular polysaccharide biosynthesis protein CpsC n=1 Tax=Lactobacillus colini TaxID=1819254 RepID=A0ABS4MEK2_9LACO|nr:Wzz/FepE/Etk N-terminal domain-containing protein [Lactobacillus colini]MBP2058113.1 capsular polysaccharide biosynthesis protein [Lactobacillus colini]